MKQQPNNAMMRALSCLQRNVICIIRVNLWADKCEVLKSSALLPELEDDVFSAWLDSIDTKKLIYEHDRLGYRRWSDLEAVKERFSAPGAPQWRFRCRMKLDGELRWVLLQFLQPDDFSESNKDVFFYMLDTNQEEADLHRREEIQKKTQEMKQRIDQQFNVLYALAGNFLTMHLIDVVNDKNYEFKSFSTIRELVTEQGNTAKQMREVMSHVVDSDHIDAMLSFTDLATLNERMRDRNTITSEFYGTVGWVRCAFTAIDYTQEGRLCHVVFTTSCIEDEKRREANLVRKSRTDEMTHLYNRLAYEEDIMQVELDIADKKISEIGFVSISVNGINEVNDRMGHAAGDELITAAAFIIFSTFCNVGRCYRMGGTEFVAMARIQPDRVEELLAELKAGVANWSGQRSSEMNISYGVANYTENPGSTAVELARMATRNMLQQKNENKK